MKISELPVPDIYKTSSDFRLFLKWFELALSKVQYDTENLPDIYDPLKCPEELLWMLADTMGFEYDDRLPTAFNRLVLLYFMSMIRNRGSKDGVTLAAEVNLAQFNLLEYGKERDILYNRLEDTSIPVNSVAVVPHTEEGYIDVIYFSENVPTDACIEYVRPLGMYMFEQAGVRYDARTKISIDAKLADKNSIGVSIGPTRVGHYRRDDYARLQKMTDENTVDSSDTRHKSWYRNSKYEGTPNIDSGYRALSSLQMSNNEHVVKSLLPQIFGLGYTPTDVSIYDGPSVLPDEADFPKVYNLRYDKTTDLEYTDGNVTTIDENRTISVTKPRPAVNPIMAQMGDAIAMDSSNNQYTKVDDQGNISIVTPT